MPRITIPANQFVKKGEMMEVQLEHKGNLSSIFLKATDDTSSASYNESFWSHEYNPNIHGFAGIQGDLTRLIEML